jgi:hypothetical protein
LNAPRQPLSNQIKSNQIKMDATNDREQLEFELNRHLTTIEKIKQADKALFKYYKDLPNADEWHSYVRPEIDRSLIKLGEIIKEGQILLKQIADGHEYEDMLAEIYLTGDGTILINLAAKIIDETLIGDCTELIVLAFFDSNIELARLLLTRREAFIYDDLFEIIKHVERTQFLGLSRIRLIESTVAAALKN